MYRLMVAYKLDDYAVNQETLTYSRSRYILFHKKAISSSLQILFVTAPFCSKTNTEFESEILPRVVVVKFVGAAYPTAQRRGGGKMIGKAVVTKISVRCRNGPFLQDVECSAAGPIFEYSGMPCKSMTSLAPPGRVLRCQDTGRASSSMTLVKAQINIQSRRNPVYSAEFPNMVHIVTSLQCVEVSNSEKKY